MTITAPQTPPAKRFIASRIISALLFREMATTYGKSPGGYIWAILEPVGAISLFTIVLALGLRIREPSLGSNFMLFYATGFLPYLLFIQTNIKIARAIRFSRQLLTYPRVTFIDAIIARFILNMMTHLVVFLLIMTGIHYAFDIDAILNFHAIALSLCMTAALGLGVGCLNCFLMSYFPIWESVWIVFTRPLLLLSTVIYTFEEVPWRYQDVVWYNPLVHVIGAMRRGFYPSYDASYVSPLYIFSIGLIAMFFGLLLLYTWHKFLLNRG